MLASVKLKKKTHRSTYNEISRRVRVTIVAMDKQEVIHILNVCVCVCVCVCSVSYPACKAHAPYYTVICGLSGFTIFLHIT